MIVFALDGRITFHLDDPEPLWWGSLKGITGIDRATETWWRNMPPMTAEQNTLTYEHMRRAFEEIAHDNQQREYQRQAQWQQWYAGADNDWGRLGATRFQVAREHMDAARQDRGAFQRAMQMDLQRAARDVRGELNQLLTWDVETVVTPPTGEDPDGGD
jgi:hypothetical protein